MTWKLKNKGEQTPKKLHKTARMYKKNPHPHLQPTQSINPTKVEGPTIDNLVEEINKRSLCCCIENASSLKATRSSDVGAFTTNLGNSILIIENSDSGVCKTLETPNIFLFPSILSFFTILIWSCFILERFVLQVKVVVSLFNNIFRFLC